MDRGACGLLSLGMQRVRHDWATKQQYILARVCRFGTPRVGVSHSVVLDSLLPPWMVVCQAPRSMEVSRQEYCSGLLFPSPGDLPDTGIEPWSPALQADSLPSEPPGKPICTLNYNAKSSIPSSESMELHAYSIYSIKQKWVNENWIMYEILNWYNDHTEKLPGSKVLSFLSSCVCSHWMASQLSVVCVFISFALVVVVVVVIILPSLAPISLFLSWGT